MEKTSSQTPQTILLVEDEDHLREITTEILRRLGYQVKPAANPDEALEWAAEFDPQLLITDVILPGMSGLALAHRIAALKPDTRILYCSAYASREMLEGQVESGPGVGFLPKPFTLGEITRSVREILDGPLPSERAPRPAPVRTESVLVVERDPRARRFLVQSLARLGYHTLEAPTGERAMAVARNAGLDLVMLGGGKEATRHAGQERVGLARALHALKPGVRFLLLFSEGEHEEELLFGGDWEISVLRGPFTPDRLGHAVREALERGPDQAPRE